MARGSTLGTMLAMLRKECRYASDSGVAQSKNPALMELLRRTYTILYDDHEWPHLLGQWEDKAIVAGSRYYDFPASINMEGAVKAYHHWGGVWQKIQYGIEPEDYNHYDSDNDARADPVLKWKVYSGTQFEVWPLPVSAGTVRFIGKQAMGSFTSETDTCLLDDHLVVLYAAAEELGAKDERGQAMAVMAKRRFDQLRALQNKTESFRPGEHAHRSRRPHGAFVVVR